MHPAVPSAVVLCSSLAVALAAPEPPQSVVPAPRADAGGAARHALLLDRVRTAAPSAVVFIGDSITEGWEREGKELWDGRFAPLRAVNLGASGDRTEHVLWRLREAPLARLEPSVVVILIGTNNVGHGRDDAAATLAGVNAVVECVRAQVPTASIVVCSIFPRGAQMNAMRGELLQVNQALARTYASAAVQPGERGRVQVLDLGTSFVDLDGSIPARLMPDGLHLSPAGYAVWAEALSPLLPAGPGAEPEITPHPGAGSQ
jgi:lysophospholipase L1-like esterase